MGNSSSSGNPFSRKDGQGGSPFDDGDYLPGIEKIGIRSGNYIRGLELYKRKNNGQNSIWHGGDQGYGSFYEFKVDSDDYIYKVRIWSGDGVDAVQFYTKKGITSAKYGGGGGVERTEGGDMNKQLVGMYGRCGSFVDQIHFRFGPLDAVKSVMLSLHPVYEGAGGSIGKEMRRYNTKKGYSVEMYTNQSVTKISAEAQAKIDLAACSGDARMRAETVSNFRSALSNLFTVEEYERQFEVDMSKPCYYYTASVIVETKNGGRYIFSDDTSVQSPTRITPLVYTI
jgi:hypothetical protein